MADNNTGSKSTISWFGVVLIAAGLAILVIWKFFPIILQQAAAGIVACSAFLIGAIFRRKR